MKPRIIFIHGMFLTPKSWEPWISYFEALGYECEAPAWPLHESEPAELRRHVPPELGKLSLQDLYTGYERVAALEPEPPIVIGHSLGGLIVQKLVSLGLVRAGVGLCSVAPNKMLALDWGFMRNSVSITNPFAGDEPYEMTAEGFRKNFGNTMSEAASNAAYETYAVHESRQVLRDILGKDGEIDVEAPHVPLLFIGAQEDEIIPNALVRRNAAAYKDERSHSEFRDFSSRSHFIQGQDGWEEVAESIANWLEGHLSAVRS